MDVQFIVLIHEGTFHQFHGGIATNVLVSADKRVFGRVRPPTGEEIQSAGQCTVVLWRGEQASLAVN